MLVNIGSQVATQKNIKTNRLPKADEKRGKKEKEKRGKKIEWLKATTINHYSKAVKKKRGKKNCVALQHYQKIK